MSYQPLIVSSVFHTIPVESMIYRKQQEYYRAINDSSAGGESTVFIEFMLNTILEEIVNLTNAPVNAPVSIGIMKTPRAIKRLQEEGKLKRVGSHKSGYWEIAGQT